MKQKLPHYFPASDTPETYEPHAEVLILIRASLFFLSPEARAGGEAIHLGGRFLFKTQIAATIMTEIQQKGTLCSGVIFFAFMTLPSQKFHRGEDMGWRNSDNTKFLLKVVHGSLGSVG